MRSTILSTVVLSLLLVVEALNIAPFKSQKAFKKTETEVSDRDLLLQAIDGLNYGVKATRADNEKIESLVQALVLSSGKKSIKFPADAFSSDNGGKNKYQRSILEGNWELQYTNGPDVLSIAKIPGVNLDYVGQRVDTESNTITNLVNASGFLADTAQEVIVEVRQVSPDKVELDFVGMFSCGHPRRQIALFIVDMTIDMIEIFFGCRISEIIMKNFPNIFQIGFLSIFVKLFLMVTPSYFSMQC